VRRAYQASLDVHVAVVPAVVERYPELLAGGLWGRARVERLVDPDTDVATLELSQFHPVQVRARVDAFIENRYYFKAREWIDLLIVSSGYDPGVLTESAPDPTSALRLRLLALTRLAPVVEPSLHLLELGPRNTGKTYLLRSLSNRVFVLSGSRGTPATLFVNLASHTPGILVQRDVVVFDEVARLHLGSAETLATLKDFLETGTFTRGSQALRSQSSTVFLGNIEVDAGQPSHRYRSLVEPLPEELRDVAFLDRLHGYLPGWEMPKLRPESFARGLGLVSDYFGEVLLRLRDHPFEARFRAIVNPYPLKSGMTQRDRVAVERMARALLKLVFPHGETAGQEDASRAISADAGRNRATTRGRREAIPGPSPWSRVHRRDKHTGTVVVDPQTGEIVTRQPTAHGVLTAAEAITIATRDHPNPAHDRASVPGARQAPVVFRRTAIHRAIGLVKAYRSNLARMPSTRRMGWRRRQNVRRAPGGCVAGSWSSSGPWRCGRASWWCGAIPRSGPKPAHAAARIVRGSPAGQTGGRRITRSGARHAVGRATRTLSVP
jgi:uncharacterized protein (TIGR02688 family)